MAIYVIGDLHLSFNTNKPMDIFGINWQNYEEKIKNGYSLVFLIKKGVDTKEIEFKKIEKDMYKILKKAEIIVLE